MQNKLFIYSPVIDTIDIFLSTSINSINITKYKVFALINPSLSLGYNTVKNNYTTINCHGNNAKIFLLLKDFKFIFKNRLNNIFIFNGSTSIILSFLLKLCSPKTHNKFILHGTLRSKGIFINYIFITFLFLSNILGVDIISVNKSFSKFCLRKKNFKFIGFAGVGVPNADCTKLILARKNTFFNKNEICVAFIGRHEKSKGFYLYEQIAEKNKNSRIKFISIGGRVSGASSKILQYGPLKRNELFNQLKKVDILIFPSISEGLGMVMVECCIAGIPTIASETDGSLQFLNNNNIGMIVKKRSYSVFIEKLDQMIENYEYFSNNCINFSNTNNNFIAQPFIEI